MADGSAGLQSAIYSKLSALTPALASGGIYAPAPQNTALPYVEIDESDAVASDVQERTGLSETVNIHVWTAPGSYGPAKQIISRIRDALHAQNLAVSGRSYAFAIVASTRVFSDADAGAIHGVVTVTVTHFS